MLENPHCPISSLEERCLNFLCRCNVTGCVIVNGYFPKVFAVSKKVHTTRNRAMGVLTEGDTQIVSSCHPTSE